MPDAGRASGALLLPLGRLRPPIPPRLPHRSLRLSSLSIVGEPWNDQIPLVLAGGLSYGLSLIPAQTLNDTEFVFTPTNGRSRGERGTLSHFWPLNNTAYIPGMLTTRPGGRAERG